MGLLQGELESKKRGGGVRCLKGSGLKGAVSQL
jgi:hypothetical protein